MISTRPLSRSLFLPAARALLIVLGLMFVGTGCASNTPLFAERPAPPGKALVYVYRQGSMLGGANTWTLYANGKAVTSIGNGGYYDFTEDPGHIEFLQLLEMRAIGYIPGQHWAEAPDFA